MLGQPCHASGPSTGAVQWSLFSRMSHRREAIRRATEAATLDAMDPLSNLMLGRTWSGNAGQASGGSGLGWPEGEAGGARRTARAPDELGQRIRNRLPTRQMDERASSPAVNKPAKEQTTFEVRFEEEKRGIR